MENTEQSNSKKKVSQSIDFLKIVKVFLSRWYWIMGCVIIALILANINLLYTTPIYITSGQLKLQDENPSVGSPNSVTSQVYSYKDKIQAESFIIKSNEVISAAVKTLNYKISYFIKGRIRLFELYPNVPFKIEILKQDSISFDQSLYEVVDFDKDHFKLSLSDNKTEKKLIYRYGQNIALGNMVFRITTKVPAGIYNFKFNNENELVYRGGSGLDVIEAGRYTNVMSLSKTDINPYFAADVLNAIMKEYVTYDIKQRKRSAQQTVQFIQKQLLFIDSAAGKSGNALTSYKTKNKIVDISSTNAMTASKLADLQKQKIDLNIQQLGIRQLEGQVNSNKNKVEIGLDLEGVLSTTLGPLVAQLNVLVNSRDLQLKQFIPQSEPIREIDKQIATIKAAIRSNISSLSQRNQTTLKFIDNQLSQLDRSIGTLPAKEQGYVKLQTDFEVNDKVRSFLSERKLEAEMNEAAIVPAASIVNPANSQGDPISPNQNGTYFTAGLFGLIAGFGLILLVRFLNPYIYDKETVESLTNTPIIGVIRKFPDFIDKDSRQALSISKPKSVFAESVRSVRTNLSFLASHKKSKTICITSEVSGEGKSFVTVNLAGTLALIDKKVILIAADLRRSKLHKAFGSNNKQGLSSYLAGLKTLEEVLIHDDLHNIDFIPSGPVPPNPSELLHTDSMKQLLEVLTPQYDYVLIDTAPVGLVSDAIPLIRQSDVNLFVIRSGKSQLRAAAIPERLSREYGLSNLAIVLNAFGDDALHSNYYTTDYSRGGGNSTYYYSDYSGYAGSGYYDDPKKWWQFWKKDS